MKKLKILNVVFVSVALILEILPFGVKMKWADFFYEKSTYHSYFDLTVWGYGDMGPFICGILTSVLLIMLVLTFFKKPKKAYLFSVCAIGLCTTMVSVIPAFYDSYTLIGLIITVILGASTELSVMMYMNTKK